MRKFVFLFLIFLLNTMMGLATGFSESAQQILEATGVKGGLVVHLGCAEGELTASLRMGEQWLVQGLDVDASNVQKAREYIRSLGLAGSVSVGHLTGKRLPYAENLVNLFVTEDLGDVGMSEVMRVLAPLGVAYIKQGNAGWKKTIKPWSENIDEWTHYLYNASGNAVSQDVVVGPPRRLQWVGGRVWARYHDRLPSMSALVSARGRNFSIEDHGSIAFAGHPVRWRLIARDAFNGVVLWSQDISSWPLHTWGFRSGPVQITRRLVAVGDRVYVTLGYNEPVVCLDAATGKTLKIYADTERTREIIHSNGALFLAVGNSDADGAWFKGKAPSKVKWREKGRLLDHRLKVMNAKTGAVLWEKELLEYFPLTLTVDGECLVFKNGRELVCVDRDTGVVQWHVEMEEQPKVKKKAWLQQAWFSPTLVMYKDVLLYANGQSVVGLSLSTGKQLWTAPCSVKYHSSPDVFVADGLVWLSTDPKDGSFYNEGRDLLTGVVKRSFKKRTLLGASLGAASHARCHRSKATNRYIVGAGNGGIELHSVDTPTYTRDDWIRGGCQYGVMPANGLLYTPPHACACFVEGKVNGFLAVAPAGVNADTSIPGDRLIKGSAYSAMQAAKIVNDTAENDWPTYRHDPARSGNASTVFPWKLSIAWRAKLESDLSSVVVAGGQVYVASVNEGTVYAIDAKTGEKKWNCIVGGRVDSPPTVSQGLVLFGCADGWVYCLRATDGELVWRFRGAPRERLISFHGRIESAWSIHGSVLVRGGDVYFAAGRSRFLDGGIYMYKLDVRTGKILAQNTLAYPNSKMHGSFSKNQQMTYLPDILSGDETGIFMLQAKLSNSELTQVKTSSHLYSTAGFLDDTWSQRMFWTVSGPVGEAVGYSWKLTAARVPHARIMVTDATLIYGFGRMGKFQHRTSKQPDHHLWAMARDTKVLEGKPKKKGTLAYAWSKAMPIQVRAMVLTGDVLFVAGPKGDYRDLKALEGEKGAALVAVSVADGKTLATYNIDAPPVWDGMAVANGRLYLSLKNGEVISFASFSSSL